MYALWNIEVYVLHNIHLFAAFPFAPCPRSASAYSLYKPKGRGDRLRTSREARGTLNRDLNAAVAAIRQNPREALHQQREDARNGDQSPRQASMPSEQIRPGS